MQLMFVYLVMEAVKGLLTFGALYSVDMKHNSFLNAKFLYAAVSFHKIIIHYSNT